MSGLVVMPGGRAHEYVPAHPERTAYRPSREGWDVVFKTFPNRPAMLKTIELQERGADFRNAWKDWTKSRYAVTEGGAL